MKRIQISIQREPAAADLPLPVYMTSGSSGADLYAAEDTEVVLEPGEIRAVSAGIRVSIPIGFEAQIRPRSGLALKHGITLINTPGTIDSDYRGLIKIPLINLGKAAFSVTRGMRIAQMVIQEVVRAEFTESADLETSERGEGGFGHTGTR